MFVCTLQGRRVKRKPPVGSAGSYIITILHITNLYLYLYLYVWHKHVCTLQGRRVKRKPPVVSAGSYIRPSTGASARDAQGARILTNTNTPPQRQGQIQIHHRKDKDKYNKHIRLLLTSENCFILIVRPILIWLGGGN